MESGKGNARCGGTEVIVGRRQGEACKKLRRELSGENSLRKNKTKKIKGGGGQVKKEGERGARRSTRGGGERLGGSDGGRAGTPGSGQQDLGGRFQGCAGSLRPIRGEESTPTPGAGAKGLLPVIWG